MCRRAGQSRFVREGRIKEHHHQTTADEDIESHTPSAKRGKDRPEATALDPLSLTKGH
jgi:hypothetical protein